jgi:hypothetical protein
VTFSFDRVNHDILMSHVAARVTDKSAQTHPGVPERWGAGGRPDQTGE